MSDHHADLPFSAEYAKSNRASCKSCGDNIAKDTLRLAIMVQVRLYRLLSSFYGWSAEVQECWYGAAKWRGKTAGVTEILIIVNS